jgi:biopolymer transport protein TolQ
LIVIEFSSSFLPAFWFLQEQVVPQDNSLFGLVLRSSPLAKAVLVILFSFSIVSWAIIIAKGRATKRAQRQSEQFLRIFELSKKWSDLYTNTQSLNGSPLWAIFLAANDELQKQTRLNMNAVQRVMQSAAISETTRLEKSLGWLASTASAAPFIGLFGTVVGIIIAFQGLSLSATASIQAVAPGIADALIATAAGIAAAVPAVLGYNHYLNRIKIIAGDMDSVSLRLMNFIEKEAMASAEPSMQRQRVPDY